MDRQSTGPERRMDVAMDTDRIFDVLEKHMREDQIESFPADLVAKLFQGRANIDSDFSVLLRSLIQFGLGDIKDRVINSAVACKRSVNERICSPAYVADVFQVADRDFLLDEDRRPGPSRKVSGIIEPRPVFRRKTIWRAGKHLVSKARQIRNRNLGV